MPWGFGCFFWCGPTQGWNPRVLNKLQEYALGAFFLGILAHSSIARDTPAVSHLISHQAHTHTADTLIHLI